ncbi:MAG: signal peptidase I, partial [Candidatus Nanohaloarchaea archaeon]
AGVALNTDVPVVAVTSGSMEPTLHRGDMVVVHGEKWKNIEEGEILVFKTEEMPVPVIHRVIKKNSTALETKGDALQQ